MPAYPEEIKAATWDRVLNISNCKRIADLESQLELSMATICELIETSKQYDAICKSLFIKNRKLRKINRHLLKANINMFKAIHGLGGDE